ncbi:TonB-dependent receptor [Arcticibacterium luteifluviistationis]|uniref:TonB-dependent receptor n=1 Tax=Arcticibacterium luteifluviistationis TaxID=1784714 RepID=A0A2Z4GCU9_9BACT|nr:TonB-dependent receptor [Arcticibacterium luteifluviistationis]
MVFSTTSLFAQNGTLTGKILSEQGEGISFASIVLENNSQGFQADENGNFTANSLKAGKISLSVSSIGFIKQRVNTEILDGQSTALEIILRAAASSLDEVVVTGTMKEVSRLETPVPVEIYTPQFFKRNPTPNIFEALQNVNGVRPQLNCNVCNTGDIHINGLEGPYTMILLDGMPIVSGLSTVYGLSGIPNSLIERVEVVKGPASSLYGSEAVGGLINIITKSPLKADKFSVDVMATNWQELNVDLGFTQAIGSKIQTLTGINYYNYQNPIDNNGDNFTDVTLQQRVSLFHKWNVKHSGDKYFNIAARYFYENRWGGEMDWTSTFRGGTEKYGESIYTKRWEVLGKYELPTKEKLALTFSYNNHDQDSYYGDLPYFAKQNIGFVQMTWDKSLKKHDLLSGIAARHTFYDDNTPATASPENIDITKPENSLLPGIFVQDEITLDEKQKVLLGYRFDYHQKHGGIHTPRVAYKYNLNKLNIVRLNVGTGFRVVNLFTEDHAALTGARKVDILSELKPEKSINANLNYMGKFFTRNSGFIGVDFTAFYTHFNNRIVPDYITDPQRIIYDNLDGYAVSKGISANLDFNFANGLKILTGATLMDNTIVENGVTERPLLTEHFSGTWSASYTIPTINLTVDYTGNLYGPMDLPVLGAKDPRSDTSPWWSIQNIQFTYSPKSSSLEVYGGIKNLLNFTPAANSIARSFDPFDKQVTFNDAGDVVATANNPYALTFDPSYVYAPNQGIRGFFGVRWALD